MDEQYWQGHRERLRGRALEEGFQSLRPHELIELVLFYAAPRVDMTETARALLSDLGSVEAVLHAGAERLTAVPGMTRAAAEWNVMTGEMVDAYGASDRNRLNRIWRFRELKEFLEPRRHAVPAPQSWVIYTDFDDRLMTYSVLCESLYWTASDCIRTIVEEALALQARHAFLVLFAGDERLVLEPWEQDCLLAFSRTLRAIDVELMDCVLVGGEEYVSMNVEGGMARIRQESEQPSLHERYCGEPAGEREET